jgi:hypothetical protein
VLREATSSDVRAYFRSLIKFATYSSYVIKRRCVRNRTEIRALKFINIVVACARSALAALS